MMTVLREAFVGIDAAKLLSAVAVAAAGRDGGIHVAPCRVKRLIGKLATKYERLHFCYEAGPTGSELHRVITELGHNCTVVALSLIPRKPSEGV